MSELDKELGRHVVTSPPAGVGDAQTRHLADEVRRLRAVVRECLEAFGKRAFSGSKIAAEMEQKCREVLGDK